MSSLQFIVKYWQASSHFFYLAKIDDYNFLKVVSLSKTTVIEYFIQVMGDNLMFKFRTIVCLQHYKEENY